MVSKKSGGADATRIGKYKKRRCCRNEKWVVYKVGRCRNEKWAVENAGALPQRGMGSIKIGSAAAARIEIGRASCRERV